MNPAERGAYLEKPPLGEASIDAAHEAIVPIFTALDCI